MADRDIRWREDATSAEVVEAAVVLWAGEVLLNSGRGLAGPFFVLRTAAESWAISAALGMPRSEVFGAQIVGYQCAASHAAALLSDGDATFKRLNRYSEPPVRSFATVPLVPGIRDQRS